jgi:hypothetical protein
MSARARDAIEANGGFAQFLRLEPPTPTETEVERFIKQWPDVASRLGLKVEPAAPEPPRLFELGECYVKRTVEGVSPTWIWRDLVDRHSRNPDADACGDVIRSRFTLDEATQKLWPPPKLWDSPAKYGDRPTRSALLSTFLGRSNTTVCVIERQPA